MSNLHQSLTLALKRSLLTPAFGLPGSIKALDEDRMQSKSRQNKCKIRNPYEPVRIGWTICKLGDTGKNRGSFVFNYLVKYGENPYTNLTSGKNYNTVWQLVNTGDVIGSGKTVLW